jgi:hypothetical protein
MSFSCIIVRLFSHLHDEDQVFDKSSCSMLWATNNKGWASASFLPVSSFVSLKPDKSWEVYDTGQLLYRFCWLPSTLSFSWISYLPSMIHQASSILLVPSSTLVADLPNISQPICRRLNSNHKIIQLSLYRCFHNVVFVVNVILLPLSIFLMMAYVFKYDSHASCITFYPLACIQKGTNLLYFIPKTCVGLTIGFSTDAGTL